jgi:hypothetical protein
MLLRVFVRCQVPELAVGPMIIVIDPPCFDLLDRIFDRFELHHVQALIAQPPIERFYVSVFSGFPGWMKSSFTPRRYAHSSSTLDVNFVP